MTDTGDRYHSALRRMAAKRLETHLNVPAEVLPGREAGRLEQYIEELCAHVAEMQDRGESSDDEITGIRRALALALGLDPDKESGAGKGADIYCSDWRDLNGR